MHVTLCRFADVELLGQHAKISLPWQQTNLNDTVKLAVLENPQFGTIIWESPCTGREIDNFVFKYTHFC